MTQKWRNDYQQKWKSVQKDLRATAHHGRIKEFNKIKNFSVISIDADSLIFTEEHFCFGQIVDRDVDDVARPFGLQHVFHPSDGGWDVSAVKNEGEVAWYFDGVGHFRHRRDFERECFRLVFDQIVDFDGSRNYFSDFLTDQVILELHVSHLNVGWNFLEEKSWTLEFNDIL